VSPPEYREDENASTVRSAQSSIYTSSALDEDGINDPSGDPLEDSDHPNVVMLKIFEERKGP
jgi:hypothetical protein